MVAVLVVVSAISFLLSSFSLLIVLLIYHQMDSCRKESDVLLKTLDELKNSLLLIQEIVIKQEKMREEWGVIKHLLTSNGIN